MMKRVPADGCFIQSVREIGKVVVQELGSQENYFEHAFQINRDISCLDRKWQMKSLKLH